MSNFKSLINMLGINGLETVEQVSDLQMLVTDQSVNPILPQFLDALFGKIITEAISDGRYTNPFKIIEGDVQPYALYNEDYMINPELGADFDKEDFEGILTRKEENVKSVLGEINFRKYNKVTLDYEYLKGAFLNEQSFMRFINESIAKLKDGLEIKQFYTMRDLVASLYNQNQVKIITATKPTDLATSKAVLKILRQKVAEFTIPSADNNVWSTLNPTDTPALVYSKPEDLIIITTPETDANLDVEALATLFNIDKAEVSTRKFLVNNMPPEFICGIFDKRMFGINTKLDLTAPQTFNANNLTYQFYYHVWKTYRIRPFANGVIIATAAPTPPAEPNP